MPKSLKKCFKDFKRVHFHLSNQSHDPPSYPPTAQLDVFNEDPFQPYGLHHGQAFGYPYLRPPVTESDTASYCSDDHAFRPKSMHLHIVNPDPYVSSDEGVPAPQQAEHNDLSQPQTGAEDDEKPLLTEDVGTADITVCSLSNRRSSLMAWASARPNKYVMFVDVLPPNEEQIPSASHACVGHPSPGEKASHPTPHRQSRAQAAVPPPTPFPTAVPMTPRSDEGSLPAPPPKTLLPSTPWPSSYQYDSTQFPSQTHGRATSRSRSRSNRAQPSRDTNIPRSRPSPIGYCERSHRMGPSGAGPSRPRTKLEEKKRAGLLDGFLGRLPRYLKLDRIPMAHGRFLGNGRL